jgi:RNA recognition motif-containing protein
VAVPRKSNPKLVMRTKKIFVGGLSATTSLEDIKAYFQQFSTVKESMLAYDKVGLPAGLRIRIRFIRIQHFRLNTDPDPRALQLKKN